MLRNQCCQGVRSQKRDAAELYSNLGRMVHQNRVKFSKVDMPFSNCCTSVPDIRPPKPILSEEVVAREARYATTFTVASLNQDSYGICGPIAVLHACALESFDRFENFAREVCRQGAGLVPQILIDEFEGERRFNTLARVMSAYLSNQQNVFMTYEGGNSCWSFLQSAAFPKDIVAWYKKFFPEREVTSYGSYCWGALDNVDEINALWSKPTKQPIVIALVNPYRLEGNKASLAYRLRGLFGLFAGSHFIHITSAFRKENSRIRFEAYNCGMNRSYDLSENKFAQVFYEVMVAH